MVKYVNSENHIIHLYIQESTANKATNSTAIVFKNQLQLGVNARLGTIIDQEILA